LNPDDLSRVFGTFEQVETSKSRKYQGAGLGLALTKKYVDLHGGCIWAESQGKDQGSTFSLILPVIEHLS
jgi:signal transduction histidine kinase